MRYTAPPYKPVPSKASGKILITTFCAGIIALIAEIDLFDVTFISLILVLLFWSAPALCVFPFCLRSAKTELAPVKAFIMSLFCAFAIAGLPLYGFMALNFYLANPKTTTQTFKVLSADNGRQGGKCIPPYIDIEYKGLRKQLTYPCGTWVDRHKVITLTISKGYLGFEVIKDQSI